jgi:hypothetical protein
MTLCLTVVPHGGLAFGKELDEPARVKNQVYRDVPFAQERTTVFRWEVPAEQQTLRQVRVDRDGKVLINTDQRLLKGYEGRLVRFQEYSGIADLVHHDLQLLEGKFVFLNSKMLLPLHGAGRDYVDNQSHGFKRVAPLGPGHFLLLSQEKIVELQDGSVRFTIDNPGYRELIAVPARKQVVLYAGDKLGLYADGVVQELPAVPATIAGVVDVTSDGDDVALMAATEQGLFRITPREAKSVDRKLPVKSLTCIARDRTGRLWVGSTQGAFSFVAEEPVNYYAGRRWLADNRMIDIFCDTQGDVYLLNAGGLTRLQFEPMTLADKADFYQRHLRQNHIRYGLVSDVYLPGGDYAHVRLHDSDNDGLWSAMYLAAESYRFAVAGAEDAQANALDGLDALERLVTINPIPGFQARSFELEGFAVSDKERWRSRPEKDFEWKGHTSSDELVGTFFCYAVMWETIGRERPEVRERIAKLVGQTVGHILDNNLYLIDIDGKPTLWGRWNPKYVNTLEVGGDRRLNSIEILAFLQLAYHTTKDERFKRKFRELVDTHGYAKNTVNWLPNPRGPWNHSDDELYWLSYYNLLQNNFDQEARVTFLTSARQHVEATQRKRNPVWNFIYGGTTNEKIDLEGSVMVLREFPLDLRRWRMTNSHREDVEVVPRRRRRGSESVSVLPPDERAIQKWNGNEMSLDGGGNEESAESGAEYLLPYWMGRYFGYITAPVRDPS